ncbi:MAG: hypothetical protein JW864_09540 [Spirochaetes bacterium]|nr:hypothetical protein [Spirochaetota bacterium]
MSKIFKICVLMIVCCLFTFPVLADKSSIIIEAPDKAVKGSEITIKIIVTHNGNNMFHHTDWAYIKINGKEVARWEYSFSSLPEDEVFSKEITYKVEKAIEIEAEANCNLHGSKGKAVKKIEVQ